MDSEVVWSEFMKFLHTHPNSVINMKEISMTYAQLAEHLEKHLENKCDEYYEDGKEYQSFIDNDSLW